MTRRILSLLLAALCLASAAACSKAPNSPADDTTTADTTTAETTTATPETSYELAVSHADYENANWNFLTRKRTGVGTISQYIDIAWQEDLEGDLFNDALYKRNTKIEQDFNVVINVTEDDSCAAILANISSSGDKSYSVVAPKMTEALSAAQQSQIYDLTTVDALQLDAPWWDEAMFRDMPIGSKLFMVTGDVSVMDEQMLYVIFCNKKLIKDNNMEDPYDIVRDGRWTIDKLHEMTSGLAKDLDGNGVWDENDVYGFGSDYSTAALLFYASGGSIARVDDKGVPSLCLMSEQNEKIIEKIASLHNDTSATANASLLKGDWATLKNMLMEDRLVFRQGNVYNIPGYREMISDFGILPLPKYSEEQENYRHVVASQYVTGMTIPSSLSADEAEFAAIILTALSANSGDAIDAYYEVNLQYKNVRDSASAAMLEIIFNSKCYDLGKVFSWANLETKVIMPSIQNPGTFASSWEEFKTAAQAAMEKSYEFLK